MGMWRARGSRRANPAHRLERLEPRLLRDGDEWNDWGDEGNDPTPDPPPPPDPPPVIDTGRSGGDDTGSIDDGDTNTDAAPPIDSGPTICPPGRPSQPVLLRQSTTSVYLAWAPGPGDAPDGYFIRRLDFRGRWDLIGSTRGDTPHFTDTRAQPGQMYLYQVAAYNDAGCSPYSNAASIFLPSPTDPALVGEFARSPQSYEPVSLFFLDADGTEVCLTLRGPGSGQVRLTPDGYALTLTGTAQNSGLLIRTFRDGDDGRLTLASIAINDPAAPAAFGTLTAPTTDVTKAVTIAGSARTLTLGDLTGVTVTVSGGTGTPLDLTAGRVRDVSVTSTQPINRLTVTDWQDTDTTMDAVSTSRIQSIVTRGDRRRNVAGDFAPDVTLTGVTKGLTLGSATVAGGILSGAWQVAGGAGPVRAKTADGWQMRLTAPGARLASLTLTQSGATNTFALAADAIGPITVAGSLAATSIRATGTTTAKAVLASLTVSGDVVDTQVRAGGSMGPVQARSLVRSLVFAGIADAVLGRPTSKADVAIPAAAIASVRLFGLKKSAAPVLTASTVAAGVIRNVTFPDRAIGRVDATGATGPFGFAALTPVKKYAGPPSAGLFVGGADATLS